MTPILAAGAVVLELFTSQGCSSCPPADALLAKLGTENGVIALAFHVDYWNGLGWEDPFSAAAWTARQQEYGKLYTPELVVDGRDSFVGSDARAAAKAIAAARARPAEATIAITGAKATVTLASPAGHDVVLLAATTDAAGQVTDVPRGENGGSRLRADFVVRSLATLGRVAAGATQATVALPAPKKGDRIAILVQDAEMKAILAAAVVGS